LAVFSLFASFVFWLLRAEGKQIDAASPNPPLHRTFSAPVIGTLGRKKGKEAI